MNGRSPLLVGVLVIAAVAGGVWLWKRQLPAPPARAPSPAALPDARTPALDVSADVTISHPVPARGAEGNVPPLDQADEYVKDALIGLFGRKGALAFLNVDGFAHAFVATVDNLARPSASPGVWPVKPTPGELLTAPEGNGTVLAARNADRYAAFVRFAETVDTRRAVRLYQRLYPLFQQAYEELGYPGRYFNDRVVEVIDHLLATPPAPAAIKLKRYAATGAPEASTVHLFEDPALEALSAGQKILLRVGESNAQRLKAKLTEARALLATGRSQRPR